MFGVTPQIIKLLSCSGIPWTQTWGMMYLIPFLIVEALNALASPQTTISAKEDETRNSLERSLHRFDSLCGILATLLQLCLHAYLELILGTPSGSNAKRWHFCTRSLGAHLLGALLYMPL
ncbi:hypothetical protein GQ43DRAFT_443156 [Delitschia confertaspora ATCC 74209]|uniref:Uncharacterized protein n=1 Tax=Delitschia confertaspora ATCC 74209 TaxID=1513339 RepID=A0A9P4JFU3_9PLEO|nr:hypothetical protein GQ43DRAFT_443156 [Delitschia confertaspora ATCC 74209]